MLTIESGIILNDKTINCKYYEIESVARNIIKAYILESDENRIKFTEFARKYKTFRPYFDFLVLIMGAKIINPLLESGYILYGKDNMFYAKKDEVLDLFSAADEETLQIEPMTLIPYKMKDCVIGPKGEHIMSSFNGRHPFVINLIINLLMINNEAVANEFLENPELENGYFLSRYYPFIRFQAEPGSITIAHSFYRYSNLTKELNEYMLSLEELEGVYHSSIKIDHHDDVEFTCDLSETLKNDFDEETLRKKL